MEVEMNIGEFIDQLNVAPSEPFLNTDAAMPSGDRPATVPTLGVREPHAEETTARGLVKAPA